MYISLKTLKEGLKMIINIYLEKKNYDESFISIRLVRFSEKKKTTRE